MWTMRTLDPATDRAAVESLWRTTMAPAWPLLPGAVDRLTGGHLAVTDSGAPAGVIAVDVRARSADVAAGSADRPRSAGVQFLAVAPEHQRRGLGSALLEAAVGTATAAGATELRAGTGGSAYVWPGVPLDLPAAVAFFTTHGWTSPHDTADLTQDLREYRDPELGTSDVSTAVADASAFTEVDVFEEAHFPQWARHFSGTTEDVMTARDADGTLIGTLLFSGPDAEHPYRPLLGPRAGKIACVGVAGSAQGRGVGSAMVAHASRVLRDRGTRTCLIDWVVRESFYGRLGYRSWRRYRMFQHAL